MMKRILLLLILFVCIGANNLCAQSNQELRVAYVLKNIGVTKDTQKKLKPLLVKYLAEKKKTGEKYDALKDKYKVKTKPESLTDDQATALLSAKWEAEEKELALKKQYTQKFKTVLTPKKVWKCFDLLNDKKSKVTGKKKSDNDEDED